MKMTCGELDARWPSVTVLLTVSPMSPNTPIVSPVSETGHGLPVTSSGTLDACMRKVVRWHSADPNITGISLGSLTCKG